MASIKNLKKEINDQIGDIIEDIYHWELSNPNENLAKTEKIIDDSIEVFDVLISKINSVEKKDRNSQFKLINKERNKLVEGLLLKISKL